MIVTVSGKGERHGPDREAPPRSSYEVKASAESQWICACGLSQNLPFCDGSHKLTKASGGQALLVRRDVGQRGKDSYPGCAATNSAALQPRPGGLHHFSAARKSSTGSGVSRRAPPRREPFLQHLRALRRCGPRASARASRSSSLATAQSLRSPASPAASRPSRRASRARLAGWGEKQQAVAQL